MASVQPLLDPSSESNNGGGHVNPMKAAVVLVALLGSAELLHYQAQPITLPELDVWLMCSSLANFTDMQWFQWSHQPDPYPAVDKVTKDEQRTRQQFYIEEMLATFCAVSTIVLILPKLLCKLGLPCRKLELNEVLPHMLQWLVFNEIIDWVAIGWLTTSHGVYLEGDFGLYWEDWYHLFLIISCAPLAEFCFGYVAVDTVALTAFPITSSRILRMKDKVLVFTFLHQWPAGIIPGVLSATVILMSHHTMLTHYKKDYVPSVFLVSIVKPERALNRDTWSDWVFEKMEIQTRDGKVVFAIMHDLVQSAIVVVSMLMFGGNRLLWISLVLNLMKPICLSSGRLVVLRQLDEWASLYILQARTYGLLAKAARITHCTSWEMKLQAWQGYKLREAGSLEEAKEILEQCLCLSQVKLGDRHPITILAMNYLAWILNSIGQIQGALAMRQDVLRLRKEILGARHPETILAMHELARSLHATGQTQEAVAMFREVLRLRMEILGARHLDTIHSMNELAVSLYATGQIQEAVAMFREVLRLRTEILGARHPDTIRAMNNLARCLDAAGQTQEALAMGREVLRLWTEILGERHPDTISAMNNLAVSLKATGQMQEALAMGQEVLRLRTEILGARHPDTIQATSNLALSLKATGQMQEALAMRREVLRLRTEILGARHPDTITAMNNLAFSLESTGQTQEALAMGQEVVRLAKEILGERHPNTIIFMQEWQDAM